MAHENLLKSNNRIFRLKNETFQYGIYKIKYILETQQNILDCSQEVYVIKKSTNPLKYVIRIFNVCSITMVEKWWIIGIIRCAFKNDMKKLREAGHVKFDLDSQIPLGKIRNVQIEVKWSRIR